MSDHTDTSTSTSDSIARASRKRDPERRERILAAAAQLFSKHGYATVNLNDIGAEAGIVGSGIYRHFQSKPAILVEFFDRVIDRLVADAEQALRDGDGGRATLRQLVESQVRFTIDERHVYQVYVNESRSLPEPDLRLLRWKQRHYVDLWRIALRAARPEVGDDEAQVLIQATINGIHSILRYRSPLPQGELSRLLIETSLRTLGVDAEGGAQTEHVAAAR